MSTRSLHIDKIRIKADATGHPPKTIELLRVGDWHTPYHTDFEITEQDIKEFVSNAEAGVGLVASDPKIPVNYGHESWEKAAGWISRLYASEDGQALLGDLEWTPAAEQAIADKEWKYISPEFNPRSWPWEDPEQEMHFVPNVLTGAALTNIPLFKKLKPITASRIEPKKLEASAETGESDKPKGDPTMDLEALRAKKPEELSDDEKTFVAEHKADLTEDERKTFGLEDAGQGAGDEDAAGAAAADSESGEGAQGVEASAKPVTISADRLAKLEADAKAGLEASQKLAETEARTFITASVQAGQIKSGEADNAVKMLLASKGDQRTQLESFIKGLPKNENLGVEHGDVGASVSADVVSEVDTKTRAVQASARAEGKTLSYAAARKQVLNDNPNLKDQLEEAK